MGVRIVATYRPAKKRSYEKGLHLEYLIKEGIEMDIQESENEEVCRNGSSRRGQRAAVDECLRGGCVVVLLHGGDGGCAAVRCL